LRKKKKIKKVPKRKELLKKKLDIKDVEKEKNS